MRLLPPRYEGDVTAVLVLAYRRSTAPERSEQQHLELLVSAACVALEIGNTVEGEQAIELASQFGQAFQSISTMSKLGSACAGLRG